MSAENLEMIKGLMSGYEGAGSDAIREMLPAMVAEFCTTDIEFVETPERVDASSMATMGSWKLSTAGSISGTSTAPRRRASRITATMSSSSLGKRAGGTVARPRVRGYI